MLYFVAFATAGMFGTMLYLAAFRLRRDRLAVKREQTRGRYAFGRPKERLRFLLNRAFSPPQERPEWEETLVSRLPPRASEPAPAEPQARRAPSAPRGETS